MILQPTRPPDGSDSDAAYARRLSDIAMGINRQNQVSGVRVNRTTRGDSVIPEQGTSTGGGSSSKPKRYHLKAVRGDYLICRQTTCKNWRLVLVYNSGDKVFYSGSTWSSVGDNNSGNQPDISPSAWTRVNTFDTTEGASAFNISTPDKTWVYIAKEWKHCNSLTAENLGGSPVTYTYVMDPSDTTSMNVIRTTHFGSSTDREHLIPFWVVDEEIRAIPADTDIVTDSNIVSSVETGLKKVTLLIIGRSTEWGAF